MRIALDFDGVLSNTVQRWIEIFNKDYSAGYGGISLSYSNLKQFDFYTTIGMSRDTAHKIFEQCWTEWDKLEPTEFMLCRKTEKLSGLCGVMDVVTANNSEKRLYLERFLQKHEIKYNRIVFEKEKEILPYDIFIDDSPDNAQRICNAGKSALLYNQPWNQGVIPTRGGNAIHLTRIHGLDHAIHVIQNR